MGKIKAFILFLVVFSFFFASNNSHAYKASVIEKSDRTIVNRINDEEKKTSQDEPSEDNRKVAYLTFDDGPSYVITNKLLDILNECNVKATFFVVGKEIKGKQKILRRIYDEGHGIGLHTYTHNFKTIYRNHENFIYEMKKTSIMIEDILGLRPRAIRFPGGSARILDASFLGELHQNGFKVYDWNVNLEDGINASASPSKLLINSKKAKGDQNVRYILAHSNYNNMNTVRALKSIINYYKEEGFEFKPIENSTPEYYYKLRK